MPKYDFDLFTIGAGSGGVRASRMAAKHGARVAVAEESRVGGTCVLRGCIPKKLLVLGAHFADDFEDARAYGWSLDATRFDWPTLIRNKNKELERLEGIYARVLRDNKVTLIAGRARLADAHTVEIEGKRYTAENILIATGGRPSKPDLPGAELGITSDEALELAQLPKRIVIVGGGYIAVEFAGIFRGLGAEVTVLIRAGTILRGFDEDVRDTLTDEMRKKGTKILSECRIRSIEKTDSHYSVRLTGGEILEADTVLFATGRAPNTKGIGLEEAGVKLNKRGAVAVDDHLRSSAPNIYAVGDVTDRLNLTPVAIAEAMCLVQTLFAKTPKKLDYDNIATAVFSQPPVATVGLTELDARERGAVDIYVARFKPLKHTLTGRDERTMMKLVVDRKTDRVIGCHMVGADAPEIIQGLAIALKCGATKAQFDATVGIHPTAAEEFVTMRDKVPEHGKARV